MKNINTFIAILFIVAAVTLVAQSTNGPISTNAPTVPPIPVVTGIPAVDSVINASPIVLVFVAIQTVLLGAKKTEKVPDKMIPLIAIALGVATYPWLAEGGWTMRNGLLGVLAGAGSTGLNQMYRQLSGYYDEGIVAKTTITATAKLPPPNP